MKTITSVYFFLPFELYHILLKRISFTRYESYEDLCYEHIFLIQVWFLFMFILCLNVMLFYPCIFFK